jgi:hypothetical protein
VGIPCQAIGIGVGLLLGIWALVQADTVKGRVFIASAMAVIFLIPVVWQSASAGLISFICWIVFGLGCYIFLKYRGVGVP